MTSPRSNRLKEYRDRRGLSLTEVATLIGVDLSTASRHESGERGLDRATLLKYAHLYRCESYELFVDLGDEQKTTA